VLFVCLHVCICVPFQNTVAKYAPRFVTSEQQDAQEFLAFVTDGIHEDLNRVSYHQLQLYYYFQKCCISLFTMFKPQHV